MAKSPKPTRKDAPKDEPGAEQRFSNILKRALNTPPPRKQAGRPRPKKKAPK